jgi:hypothetical protein
MGVVAAVREWPGESSLSVAGGDSDGATGEATIRVGYTPRVSAVTATGEAERRLATIRRERARETVDETLTALAEAVDGERLPNVRAAAWLNDTLDADTLDREDAPDWRDAPGREDALDSDVLDSDEEKIARDTTSRLGQLSLRGPVSPSENRLRRRVEQLLPTASVCLTLVAATLVVSLGNPTAALAALEQEVTVAGTPVVAAVVAGGSATVWQLLVVTLLPPAVTLSAVTRSGAALARQAAAVRDVTAWLTTRRGSETTVDASGAALVAAVETVTQDAEASSADDESVSDPAAFLEDRLAASALELTTRPSSELDASLSRHAVVSVLLAVGATLSVSAVPLAGTLGRADAVVPFLSLAAVTSLPASWLAAVVALWRS